ncbi:MAG TPA: hypothetical protein VFR90_00565 [Methylibium sp.]|uniref:hypothetical protein n=1 Tax=Methylibium sp. TaxID=2067992 RepID=UPI002DB7671C|nr:hypothetical protein [Methylibium sp.]HEU4457597.1 hypothetical protein [Methylibium sp.]
MQSVDGRLSSLPIETGAAQVPDAAQPQGIELQRNPSRPEGLGRRGGSDAHATAAERPRQPTVFHLPLGGDGGPSEGETTEGSASDLDMLRRYRGGSDGTQFPSRSHGTAPTAKGEQGTPPSFHLPLVGDGGPPEGETTEGSASDLDMLRRYRERSDGTQFRSRSHGTAPTAKGEQGTPPGGAGWAGGATPSRSASIRRSGGAAASEVERRPTQTAATFAQAYKHAGGELNAAYAEPPREPRPAAAPERRQPRSPLAAGFSALRRMAPGWREKRPDVTERLGVFAQPRNMNRDSRRATEAERPGKVRPVAAASSAIVSGGVDVTHAQGRTAQLPPVIPAMDFRAVNEELKREDRLSDALRSALEPQRAANPEIGRFRNRFPEPDPAADTRRLRTALTDPPSEFDGTGAYVPPSKGRLERLLGRMAGPLSHERLMGRVQALQRQRHDDPVPGEGRLEAATSQQLSQQQERLMARMTGQEQLRIAKVACQRSKAYISKAERNLVDAQQTLIGVRNLTSSARERAALDVVLHGDAMPERDRLLDAGLLDVAELAARREDLRACQMQLAGAERSLALLSARRPDEVVEGVTVRELMAVRERDVELHQIDAHRQRELVEDAVARLSPQTVSRYVHHVADTLAADLFELRDAMQSLPESSSTKSPLHEALAELDGPDARAALRALARLAPALHAAVDEATSAAEDGAPSLDADTRLLLRRAGTLAVRAGRMPMIERGAAAFFEAVRVRHSLPAAASGPRAAALREAAAADVAQITEDLAAMRLHLQAQEHGVEALETELQAATARSRAAERRATEHMLGAPAQHGFAAAASYTPRNVAAFKDALMGVYDRIAARTDLEARASSPAMVVGGAMRALSMASEGDLALATAAAIHLSRTRLVDLARPAQTPGPAEAAARRAASLLARVPRGIEILQHLTGDAGPVFVQGSRPPDPRLEAVKIFLRSQADFEDPPEWPEGVRTQVAAFRRRAGEAAAIAAAADDPRAALARTTTAQRAAFHAMRNGMDHNAPGSAYAKANDAMLELSRWLRAMNTPGLHALTPFIAMEQAIHVMDTTGNPTVRRVHDQMVRTANDNLVSIVHHGAPPGFASFERTALLSLLQEVAAQGERVDVGALKIDPAMLERARAAAQAQGLEPDADPRERAAGAAGRSAAEFAFDGLLDKALEDGHVTGHAVLEGLRNAMKRTNPAVYAESADIDSIRRFVDALTAEHPRAGALASLDLALERARQAPDAAIGASDLLASALLALPPRPTLTRDQLEALPADARAVHELVEHLHDFEHRLSGSELVRELLPLLGEDEAAAGRRAGDEAVSARLPELQRRLDALSRSLPGLHSLHMARALVDGLSSDVAHDPRALSRPLQQSHALPLATWRADASMRRQAAVGDAFTAMWQHAQAEGMSVAGLMSHARSHMAAFASSSAAPAVADFDAAVGLAESQDRIKHAPPPRNADELLDTLKYTLTNMTWRDRGRLSSSTTVGLNTDRAFSVPTPVPFLSVQGKFIVGLDQRREAVFETFMSSPAGPQLVFGVRNGVSGEGGLGIGVGFSTDLIAGEPAPAAPASGAQPAAAATENSDAKLQGSLRVYAEGRGRYEASVEDGVSLRVPRYLGHEARLHDQFLSLVNDLLRIARDGRPSADGRPADLFGELLAAQPEASLGPQKVRRDALSSEGLVEGGLSLGFPGNLGGLGFNGGVRRRRESANSTTQPTAYVHWPNADSKITTQVTMQGNLGWSPLPIRDTETRTPPATPAPTEGGPPAAAAPSETSTVFSLAGVPVGITTNSEVVTRVNRRLGEQTYFDGEHFYDWAARGYEVNDMKMFRDSTLARLSQWAELAAIRAPQGIPPEDRYALGEKFVLDLVSQAQAIGKRNQTTTAVSFDILLPEFDPQIDHLHREAWFAARRGDAPAVKATEALLDRLFTDPDARRVALMHVSNSTRSTVQVGLDYFVKAQATYAGESRKTMIQVPQANPIVDGPLAERRPIPPGIRPAVASPAGTPASTASTSASATLAPKQKTRWVPGLPAITESKDSQAPERMPGSTSGSKPRKSPDLPPIAEAD